MKKTKTRRKFKRSFKTSIILVVACLLAVSLGGIKLLNTNSETNEKRQEYEDVSKKCVELEAENAELQQIIDSGDEDACIERVARENGYVMPDERVYVDISDE